MEINTEQLITFINDVINNGIPIKDTYTWNSSISNGVVTALATIMGGLLAIWGSRKQDKKRIKEEIKLSRYNQFQNSYDNMYILINNLINHIESINNTYSDKSEWNVHIKDGVIYNLRIMVSLNEPLEIIKSIRLKINEIHRFIESNKRILGLEYNPYDAILEEIKELYNLFSNVPILLSSFNSGFYNLEIQNQIEDFNSKIDRIINSGKMIEDIYSDMEKFKMQIEEDTINIYF
ncbi:hypothetical protein [Clostridioides difficile]|uniref:hypothetical protein n=1 Tax=Clostridioides difficile TaxID=1496 RepID=UPI001C16BB32|nr:hypothetical protein [Clostridioides difficile]HBF6291373.1 hypothetical protein [Clostridioides difficile]HBG4071397.1 hypothetical protein [Clostridioides difficile]HBY2690101.1 hypothetical protein [Clostridioides difficile]HDO9121453.1 hypothetical protein [Clostridioides difficile]